MKAFKILVPTDFSENARVAINYAIQFAEYTKAHLTFFHSTFVLIPTSSSKQSSSAMIEKEISTKENLLQTEIEKIYQSLGRTVDIHRTDFVVSFGPSVLKDILEAVDDLGINLIISSTKGASGLKRIFFGSNTANLIIKSPIPILAIPPKAKFEPIKEIIYSTDLYDFDKEVKQIEAYCEKLNARYSVINFALEGLDYSDEKELIKEIKSSGIKYVQGRLPMELPLAFKIKKYMKRHKGAILTMFKESKSSFLKILTGSNTEDVVFDLEFPLLVFKKEQVLELNRK